MSTTEPHVGDVVRLVRSGHALGSAEAATIISVHAGEGSVVLRVRWPDGRETFVPVEALMRG